ncbi:hypothetical protein LOZ65_006453 [Ophidiomyces ophidiicola]|nr:hypothetical protein LOZ65_006453 [Ophidiomyces ophidiicola]
MAAKKYWLGRGVLSLSSNIAVQCGFGISNGRASTQDYAYRHVDPAVVRIPKVYRFFEDWTTGRTIPDGYLFMENMPGKTICELDEGSDNAVSRALTKRISNIALRLLSIKAPDGTPPGPADGSPPHGYLWGDDGSDTAFASAAEWNLWLNKRLKILNLSIDIIPCYPLVLCHGDLVRRNIIVLDDRENKNKDYEQRQLALVDWGHSALLPRVCELVAMSCYHDRGGYQYTNELLKITKEAIGLTEAEQKCYRLLISARAMTFRYKNLYVWFPLFKSRGEVCYIQANPISPVTK